MAEQQKDDFKYEIIKALGVISVSKTGWTREANVISWNGRPAKLDIRDWAPDHSRMSRGITLNGEESIKLMEILNSSVVKHEDAEEEQKAKENVQEKATENVSETVSEQEKGTEKVPEQETEEQAEEESAVAEENPDEQPEAGSESNEASQVRLRPQLRMPVAAAAQG